eukprot:TRINITY_DN2871_c3_g1_i3.p1 TRINITY_DN2871_c3_g1~~TRINITY_DN2871_c3_g1_i3.p1  ORF type:complete len:206 (+),score=9.98 TRINITY_DN2871_c3_g1_i3:468-1085(+)
MELVPSGWNMYEEYQKEKLYQVWIKDMQIIEGENNDLQVTFGISGAGFKEYIDIVSTNRIYMYYMKYDQQAEADYWDSGPEISLHELENEAIQSLCKQWRDNNSQTSQLSEGWPCYKQDQRFTKIIFTPYSAERNYVGEIEVNKENGQIEKSKKKYSQCLLSAILYDYPIYLTMSRSILEYIKEKQEEIRANQSEKNNMQTVQIE